MSEWTQPSKGKLRALEDWLRKLDAKLEGVAARYKHWRTWVSLNPRAIRFLIGVAMLVSVVVLIAIPFTYPDLKSYAPLTSALAVGAWFTNATVLATMATALISGYPEISWREDRCHCDDCEGVKR